MSSTSIHNKMVVRQDRLLWLQEVGHATGGRFFQGGHPRRLNIRWEFFHSAKELQRDICWCLEDKNMTFWKAVLSPKHIF